jgi:hypothetical protein
MNSPGGKAMADKDRGEHRTVRSFPLPLPLPPSLH